ncbi:hypothetical protein Poli38472_003260 [Pythium oligandrum]|uniref:Uncharacterized protein n=1 Tax=Pythium oligandrum TaxID=41045 RepID=A0A8K1C6P8_PYTOL|nr:hypothetical protein Poli38472_003260 [Pythium oligandrum]|eukprot:TMW57335.1 hypothetical protein Poli38472_003260 [Pythium oligandrum]
MMTMMRMSALRHARRLSTQVPKRAPVQEYPTSFISHLRTQKLNVFNIGMAFLAFSLSSQLVSYKNKNEELTTETEKLHQRVQKLEEVIMELGGTVPKDEAEAAAAEAAEAAAKADAERIKREREQEARALTAVTEEGKPKKKGLLI